MFLLVTEMPPPPRPVSLGNDSVLCVGGVMAVTFTSSPFDFSQVSVIKNKSRSFSIIKFSIRFSLSLTEWIFKSPHLMFFFDIKTSQLISIKLFTLTRLGRCLGGNSAREQVIFVAIFLRLCLPPFVPRRVFLWRRLFSPSCVCNSLHSLLTRKAETAFFFQWF